MFLYFIIISGENSLENPHKPLSMDRKRLEFSVTELAVAPFTRHKAASNYEGEDNSASKNTLYRKFPNTMVLNLTRSFIEKTMWVKHFFLHIKLHHMKNL